MVNNPPPPPELLTGAEEQAGNTGISFPSEKLPSQLSQCHSNCTEGSVLDMVYIKTRPSKHYCSKVQRSKFKFTPLINVHTYPTQVNNTNGEGIRERGGKEIRGWVSTQESRVRNRSREVIYPTSDTKICNTLSLYPVHILSGCATKAGRARGATNVAPQVLRQMMLTRVNMGQKHNISEHSLTKT